MPMFDYKCQDCGHKFTVLISNRDKPGIVCTKCGSKNIKQVFTSFATLGKKSSTISPPKTCGG